MGPLKMLLDDLCAIIYTGVCVGGLHASFFGSSYKHAAQKVDETLNLWAREKKSSAEGRGAVRSPLKTGTAHGEPLSVADPLSLW